MDDGVNTFRLILPTIFLKTQFCCGCEYDYHSCVRLPVTEKGQFNESWVHAIRRELDARPSVAHRLQDHQRPAAVSLLLRKTEATSPEILLIKRAEYPGDPWSGHVALPGGRMEPLDSDLARTAIRETREELSIDLDRDGEVIGTLSDVAPASPHLPPIVIRPYVVVVTPTVLPVPSFEVAAAFWVPLEELRDPGARVVREVRARGTTFPVTGYNVGQHFVWGLTERILRDFLERTGAG